VARWAGTYWYHAHAGSLRVDGPVGALIIEDPYSPLVYDEEHVLQITDWWHEDMRQQAAGLDQIIHTYIIHTCIHTRSYILKRKREIS
jgi:FtsP/CotA-like multicopper oxidase with cupredoxin domain